MGEHKPPRRRTPGNLWNKEKPPVPSFHELREQNKPNHRQGGRPRLTADIRRTKVLHARVTPGELEAVQGFAEQCGVNLSEYLVIACFAYANKKSPARDWGKKP